VYDYAAGKADWGSFGLPLARAEGSETRVGGYVRTDVPNCQLTDRLQEVCRRLDESGWDTCFVLDDGGVVLGRIGRRAIRAREDVTAEEAMTPGPSTIRPSARVRDTVERMRRQNLTNLPVTTSDGRLVGLLTRRDARASTHRRQQIVTIQGLRGVASLRTLLEAVEELQVRRARELGWSWQQIAALLGVSKQAVSPEIRHPVPEHDVAHTRRHRIGPDVGHHRMGRA
jgi:CBS domain-containing protein